MRLRSDAWLRVCDALTRRSYGSTGSASKSAYSPCRQLAFSPGPTNIHRAALHSSPRRDSAWTASAEVTPAVVGSVANKAAKNAVIVNPAQAVAEELKSISCAIRNLVGSRHPSLDRAAKYYTQVEGKLIRPLIVLQMSRATYLCPKSSTSQSTLAISSLNSSISPAHILADANPSAKLFSFTELETHKAALDILPTQRRLAEITEIIHTASLLHDDVIDHSTSRRGSPSANLAFGNKMTVLAGNFLLGRASVALARLRDPEVIELLASVLTELAEGEYMQLKNTECDERIPEWSEETVRYYLRKSYLKTASLISRSCRAAALLGNANDVTVNAAYSYGRNLGLAFQIIDDLLDYTQSGKDLGKPAGADLELGLATAPLLLAWKQMPELGALVGRKFAQEGDVERARDLVLKSDGIEQTRALARDYADKAIAAIIDFPDSEAKDGLIEMAQKTLQRQR